MTDKKLGLDFPEPAIEAAFNLARAIRQTATRAEEGPLSPEDARQTAESMQIDVSVLQLFVHRLLEEAR